MPTVSTKNGEFVLAFSQDEFNELGLDPTKEYRLVKVKEGVWVLSEEGRAKEERVDETEQKIISLLKKKSLGERVEGKFEKYLSDKELKKFNELLKKGVIEKFKLSQKYKKAVYELKGEKLGLGKEKVYEEKEKPFDQYSLEKDGFIIARAEERVKKLSNELSERIKNNEVKGIKSFDGNFYIIETKLYGKKADAVLNFLQNKKSAYLNEISKGVNLTGTLTKVICEFLKDEGSIIEKRRELYQLVQ
jgi:hypothetical protein